MSEYQAVVGEAACDTEIKNSRFLARAHAVADREHALAQVAQWRARYPDARHCCWAYRIGPPQSPTAQAMSDDGEPSGTAGRPILQALHGADISDCCIVVVRYFGGIKLGAAGLARAYGLAARRVLAEMPLQTRVPSVCLRLYCRFGQEQILRHQLGLLGGLITDLSYAEHVCLSVSLPQMHAEALRRFAQIQQMRVDDLEASS